MDSELVELSAALGRICLERGLVVATAESCTGGWAAEVITHTAGSSAWFDRGFVTYANAAKADMLGVRLITIETFGAVSLETAGEMAAGALTNSNAMISLAITGIAGPAGGSQEKPVGTVCFGWCLKNQVPSCERRLFEGDREAVRRQSVIHALSGLIERARNMP
ncbi:MAG: CinA family protein [Rhodocyclaceae bacterium]|jgi:nicotinamide-nucleotide amidase